MKHVGWPVVMSLVLVAGCSKASSPAGTGAGTGTGTSKPPPKGLGASLAVTSAALADDCGQGVAPGPKPAAANEAVSPAARQDPAAPAAGASMSMGACAPGVDCSFHAPCQQSSVQLQLAAVGAGTPAPVVIGDIELLDKDGKLLGKMTGRTPQVWTSNVYGAWDAQLRPGESLRLTVPTSAPPWDKVTDGRYAGGMFQVRVTVTVGGTSYSATSTTSVAPEPMVAT